MQSLSVEAIRRATESLRDSPENLDALLLLGRAEMAQERYGEARALFARAVQHHPASARAQFLLGFCLYVDNDFRQAIPVLRQASKLNPKEANPLLYLALSHRGLAQPAEARKLFEAALRLSADPEIRLAYARTLIEDGELSAARPLVLAALQSAPRSRDAHYESARLKLESGSAGLAVAEAELALQLAGSGVTDRQIHFLLTKAYAKLGDTAQAVAHRQAFEAIPPRLIR